jgi:hypothetical protein
VVEYKSKEFVDDSSDDDIALVPSASAGSRVTHSSSASTTAMTSLSVDVSAPPSNAFSVQPSVFVSVPPSMQVSEAPSVDVTLAASSSVSDGAGKTDGSGKSKSSAVREASLQDVEALVPTSSSGQSRSSKVGANKEKQSKKRKPTTTTERGKSKRKKNGEETNDSVVMAEKPSSTSASARKGKKRAVIDSDEEVDNGDVSVVVDPGPPAEVAQPKPKESPIAKEKTTAPDMQEHEKVGFTSTPVCVAVNAQYAVHYSRKTPPSQHLLSPQQPQPRPSHPNHHSHKRIQSLARVPCPSSSVASPPVQIPPSLPPRLRRAHLVPFTSPPEQLFPVSHLYTPTGGPLHPQPQSLLHQRRARRCWS